MISSGIKVLVLAVIIGIRSTLFLAVHHRPRRRHADDR
ncbi:hypothetical protein KKY_2634 [Pelagibacterium halotolerans B2]|uniref:Uncharacterized protein n=1 Tax=Pelagibacterium halotolerans (strain DSM 22347 / JCM 15775 / CGMCC 1.7692 / B2) TaxID=1082931 RepID=G4RBG6_PELHB|nr:hypothetical protein KKY_2634 [Pelagibacterium halotolerans B2]